MHKKLTRIYQSATDYEIQKCGCPFGEDHDDQGEAFDISQKIGEVTYLEETEESLKAAEQETV